MLSNGVTDHIVEEAAIGAIGTVKAARQIFCCRNPNHKTESGATQTNDRPTIDQ